MAKIKLKDKETKFIKLPDNYRVEHQTDKGILIANEADEGEWFPLAYVKTDGDGGIEIADWLVGKSDLLSDIAGAGDDKDVPF
jgi:hypothetical protein